MKHPSAVRTLGIILSLGVVSCAHHPATATGGINSHQQLVTAETQNSEFAGSIDKIDVVDQRVTVQHWPLYKTFQVGPQCEISVPDKDTATLADLKVGQSVTVSYQKNGSVLEADRIARRSREYDREKEEQYERMQEMLYPTTNH